MNITRRDWRCVTVFCLISLTLWSLLRIVLWGMTGLDALPIPAGLMALGVGLWFDICTLAYTTAGLCLLTALWPNRWQTARWIIVAKWLALWTLTYLVLFGVASEITFWQEFSTRFNFIAVDYLVYTHEVIGNIVESYPLAWIFSGLAALATVIVWLVHRYIGLSQSGLTGRQRLHYLILALAAPALSTWISNIDQMEVTTNQYASQLAGNGLFTFSAAARRNELNYNQFYATIPQIEADSLLSQLGLRRQPLASAPPSSQDSKTNLAEASSSELPAPFIARPKNIVLVSVESLSASYLGAYGDDENLSPEMDKLIQQGFKFERMFATGTRTVRGLEALSLGIPPIPGQSIVHRPDNESLATIGEYLRPQGFNTYFIYGGYGVFDNMNNYFRGNHYEVVDRTDFDPKTIVQENVWGVADESLFNNSLAILDASHQTGKPFFAHIMTTSNHRPFTYPTGRIDIAPGHRDGAVKYTDYAIGDFIKQAQSKPWFKDTLFVIVADHCASSAGKTKLPVDKYHIAAFFYNPNIVKPYVHEKMTSQLDLAPTLLDILGKPGKEHFFGQSIFNAKTERAFISNYQELGYLKNNTLIVLSPKQKTQAYQVDMQSFESISLPIPPEDLLKEAIAYYQTASNSYREGRLKINAPN